MSTSLGPWMAVAVALHASLGLIPPRVRDVPRPLGPPMEIELPAPAPTPATPPRPMQVHEVTPTRASTHASPPAPVAQAAPLLTASPSPNADPVSFVTDPSGNAFGYGVVARGGTAMRAPAAPPAAPDPSSRPVAAPFALPAPASDWTRPPRLDGIDPCRGFFPGHAVGDVGRVELVVVIDADGHVVSTAVTGESPVGDGFGEAARACLRTKTFVPALGRDGGPARATATVRIRFSR